MRLPHRTAVYFVFALLLPAALEAQWTPTGSTDPIFHNGTVTIGTSTITSGYTLDVAGASRMGGNVFLGTNTLGTFNLYLWPDSSGSRIHGTGIGIDFVAQGGTIHLFNGNTIIEGWDPNPPTNTALTVKGTTASSANGALKVTDASNNSLLFVRNDGNVGIGTSAPGLRLDVNGTSAVSDGARTIVRLLDSTPVAQGVGAGMDFWGSYTTATPFSTHFANLKGVKANGTSGDVTGCLIVSVNDSTGHMRETATVSTAGMSVTGDVTATGRISASYTDLAEWVAASEKMPSGTVVVVNPDADNGVVPSSRAYDTAVAGVVSARPGILLGSAGSSKEQVATTGRVRVLVDATRAPIQRGDLLVTSDEKGMAMKSVPIEVGGRRLHQPGTVIGKALEPLASGRGEILVLLSLQ